MTISRRRLLAAGGLTTGAAMGGVPLLAGPAEAALPSSDRFDLRKPSYRLLRNIRLHERNHAIQAIAFDNRNGLLYTLQSGIDGQGAGGKMSLTQLTLDGRVRGYMHLHGFGHGGGLGIRPPYVWTEGGAGSDGFGRKMVRFKFYNGRTLTMSSPEVQDRTPRIPGWGHPRPAFCPAYGYLAVRFGLRGFAVFSGSDADANRLGRDNALAVVKTPAGLDFTRETPQGHTIYGRYLYVITGDAYPKAQDDATDPDQKIGNTKLTCIDLNTGRIVQGPRLTRAAYSLKVREPEGIAIQLVGRPGEEPLSPRLCFAFKSVYADGIRRATVYYKAETF